MSAVEFKTVPLVSVLSQQDGIRRGPWGGALKKDIFVTQGYPVYEQGHVIRNDFTDVRYFIDDEKFSELAAFDVTPGDILMTGAGTIGTLAVVPSTARRGVFNQALLRFRLDDAKIDESYFLRVLCRLIEDPTAKLVQGSALKNLMSIGILKEVLIPLPPLPEQKRIAAILDKADAIKRKRQEAIRLTEELLRAAFLEMFGDPVTNPKGWPVKKLGEVGELDRGRSRHRPRNDPRLLGGKYPLIQTGDVANACGVLREYTQTYSDLGLAQSKLWPRGTLCITIAANIAQTAVLAFDACFPDSVVGFTPGRGVTTEYVQEWLSFLQPTLEAQAPQSAQKNINLQILRELGVPVPTLAVQRTYSDFVQKHRQTMERMDYAQITGATLANCLAQSSFSGDQAT